MAETAVTKVEEQSGVVIVHILAQNLDEQNIGSIREDLNRAVGQWPAAPFVLDMANVQFVPSLTLGSMVRLATEFKVRKQRLILAGMQPAVRKTFVLTRLDRLMEILGDVPAAVRIATPVGPQL
jgi:anti-anti-sigma factor